jgi:hypothetical protein
MVEGAGCRVQEAGCSMQGFPPAHVNHRLHLKDFFINQF